MRPTYIDYFGGTHGNFLSLVIDLYIKQFPQPSSLNFFNQLGASHEKLDLFEYWRQSGIDLADRTKTGHYSVENRVIKDANVLRVRLQPSNKFLIAVVNSFVRTGDHYIDLHSLHIDTLSKLDAPKLRSVRQDLINQYGKQHSYSQSQLRPFFVSKFTDAHNGVELFNTFADYENCNFHDINFDNLFELNNFYEELNRCAFFLNENFYPTHTLVQQWKEFIAQNHGYQSWTTCTTALDKIIQDEPHEINLSIVEQAWINSKIAKIYRVYDHPLLTGDDYPNNTLDISNALKERNK